MANNSMLMPLKIERQFSGALDANYEFETLEELKNYASTSPLSYSGQILYCKENDTLYKVNNDKTDVASLGSGGGEDTVIPYIGDNGNWYVNENDTGVPATGQDGMSAYEVAVAFNGFEGTEEEWLESLKGTDGIDGYSPTVVENANNTEDNYKLDITTETTSYTTPNLKGKQGVQGEAGKDGEDGTTYTPSIGEVTTVDSTELASATVSVNTETKEAVFNFAIPRGNRGLDGVQISDNETVEDKTWSSQKTSSKIAEKIDKTNILTALDDAATDDQVYSAKLVNDELDKKANNDEVLKKTDIVDNLTSTDTDKPLSANQGKILNDTKLNKTDANKLNCVTIDNVSLKEYILTNFTEIGKTYYLIARTTCTDLPKASNFYITVETPGLYTYKVTAKELNDSNGKYVCTYRTISSSWTEWEKVLITGDITTTISDSLVDKQDFRIFKSLEEFNEKKGTSFTVVSGIDNMKDIVNAMSEGDMLIITTKYTTGSEIYFGLDSSTGWTKMFTFIKANGLCDVECRTTTSSTFKRVLNADGVIGAWQELATMDKVDGEVDKDKVAHIKRFYSVPENDWNNAIEEGYYSIQNDEDANAIGNKPHKYALQIRVIRADTNDVNYAYQIAYVSSEDTSIYIRRQKRDGTWLPWGKVCITTVADVGVTTITPVNSNITGNIEYTVKNGICYVSMRNLMSTISSTNLLISTTMPKPSINCTASSINAGGNIAMIYIDKNTTNLRGNFYTKNAKSDCSLSYPVAE